MIRRKYNTEMRLREERLDEAWSTRKEVGEWLSEVYFPEAQS